MSWGIFSAQRTAPSPIRLCGRLWPIAGPCAAGFRIGLDPLNTLAVALVGDQLRRGEPHSLGDLPLGVQLRLRPIYSALDRAMPDDPNPRRFVGLIDGAGMSALRWPRRP